MTPIRRYPPGMAKRAVDLARGAVLVAAAILSCVAFVSAVLWATGWATLLPEPVRSPSAWVAVVTVAVWILVAGVWALRESVRYFRDWLAHELDLRRWRREVREGKRRGLYGPPV